MTQSPRRSCPHLFLNGQLQQPDWSCCSGSNAHCYTQSHLLEHWWHYQQVAVVHGLICMDKPDTPIDLIIQRLRWSCVSKSLQQPDWCSCPNLVLNGRLQQADWSCCSENTAHWKTDDIINKWHLSIAWMEKPDTSISTTVQGLKWSCMSKSLQDWWPSQQVAVVLMLFWMDSCNNLIGSVVQRVTLTGTLMTLQWQLSIAWFAWTSQTPQMVQVASACIHTAATVSVLQLDKFAVQMKQVFPGRQHCLQQLNADYCQPPASTCWLHLDFERLLCLSTQVEHTFRICCFLIDALDLDDIKILHRRCCATSQERTSNEQEKAVLAREVVQACKKPFDL